METDIQKSIELEKNQKLSIMIRNTIAVFAIIMGILLFNLSFFNITHLQSIFIISASGGSIFIVLILNYLVRSPSANKNRLELFLFFIIVSPLVILFGGPKSPFVIVYMIILFQAIIIDEDNFNFVIANILPIFINIIYIIITKDIGLEIIVFIIMEILINIFLSIESKDLLYITHTILNKYKDEKKTTEMMENVNKEKDEFISTASHELRSPISAVRGYLQLLTIDEDYQKLPRDTYDDLKRLTASAEDLNKVVDNLLNTSRIDLNRIYINKVDTNLNLQIFKSFAKIVQKAELKKMKLIFKPYTENTIVNTDSEKLSDVIVNIIDNSIENSPEGAEIIITTEKKDNTNLIIIRDFGYGIPQDILPHIFEKFYITSNKNKRTGLGLYLSYNFMRMIGGSLKIESIENTGTTAIIEI
ncbi:MAG: sensor histidine kinase [Patescibacteria group bacterium]